MKHNELPQDKSALSDTTRELCYVKDNDGRYCTELSTGWEVKVGALNSAWEKINENVIIAKEQVVLGQKSPLYYLMIKNLMDLNLLSKYTGFFKFRIKQHFKPAVFKKLNDKKLKKYADAFNIGVDEIKNFEY